MVLLGVYIRELLPGDLIFHVAPEPLDRIEFWAIGWQQHESDIVWDGQSFGGMRTAIVEDENVQAVRISLGEGVEEDLKVGTVAAREAEKKVVTRRWRDGTIHIEALKGVLHRANRLHASRRQAAAADRQ